MQHHRVLVCDAAHYGLGLWGTRARCMCDFSPAPAPNSGAPCLADGAGLSSLMRLIQMSYTQSPTIHHKMPCLQYSHNQHHLSLTHTDLIYTFVPQLGEVGRGFSLATHSSLSFAAEPGSHSMVLIILRLLSAQSGTSYGLQHLLWCQMNILLPCLADQKKKKKKSSEDPGTRDDHISIVKWMPGWQAASTPLPIQCSSGTLDHKIDQP